MNTNIVFSKSRYIVGDNVIVSKKRDEKESVSLQREFIIVKDFEYSVTEIKDEKIYKFFNLDEGSYIITIGESQGAFTIDKSQKDSVIYGFLSDFEKPSNSKEIESLCRLHIDTVQFYDWMYRHDDLISKDNEYYDPMNRKINLNVISDKVDRCKQKGMRAFAYGAIYAATERIFNLHPQWCLYTIDKKPLKFADWLFYMNISKDNGWSHYISQEFLKAVKEIGFQGIHMDTYGFPKTGCDYQGNIVYLEDEIPSLMEKVNKLLVSESDENGIIFNAVNDWPTEKVSKCSDAAYIEVWPPHDSYYDLYLLIKKAKLLGHENVVLACYMEPFREDNQKKAENAWKLTFATINSSGGTQLVMGEENCVLSNSYYADYSHLRSSFISETIRYFDFIVAYKNYLYKNSAMDVSLLSSGGINEDIIFSSKKAKFSQNGEAYSIWTIIKESRKTITCQLINLTTNNNLWNKEKEDVTIVDDIIIKLRLNRIVKNIFISSPDLEDIRAVNLEFDYDIIDQGRLYFVKIPSIKFWSMVVIEME